jgi:hypothetical protein
VAFFRADFENFQRDNQQIMCDLHTTITRLVLKITQIREDSKNHNDGQQAHHDRVPSQPTCKRVPKKIKEYKDIPIFIGFFCKDKFLEWLLDLERIFDYMRVSEDERERAMTYKLKHYASNWWDQLQVSKTQQGKSQICSWPRMKKVMVFKFYPYDYKEILSCMDEDYRPIDRCLGNYTYKENPSDDTLLTCDESEVTWPNEGDVLDCECVDLMLEVDDLGIEENIEAKVCDEIEVLKDNIPQEDYKELQESKQEIVEQVVNVAIESGNSLNEEVVKLQDDLKFQVHLIIRLLLL